MPRTQGIPYFGICLGMQIAVMSYARNVLGYEDANSSEFDSGFHASGHRPDGEPAGRFQQGRYDASGRLSVQDSSEHHHGRGLRQEMISERHRHRYEFNNNFREEIENTGHA